ALKNQYFEKIRNVDDKVEFRGRIAEVKFASSDKYNLTFKVKSPVERLAKLTSHVTAEWLEDKGKITAYDATTITNSEAFDEPPAYVSASTAVMIVPATDVVAQEDEIAVISDYTAGATQSGLVADLNDDDPDTYVQVTKATVDELYQVIQGTSTYTRENAVKGYCEITVDCRDDVTKDITLKLQYYNWVSSLWVTIADNVTVKANAFLGDKWIENIPFKASLTNVMIKDPEKTFKFRVILSTSGAASFLALRISMCEVNFYLDAKYDGSFLPITAYTTATKVTVNVNPTTAGVEIGDTFLIGWKDSIILGEIFDEYDLPKFIPFTVNIGTLNTTYTSRSFWHMDLMACLEYFMEKHRAHYWFDHENNILYIRTEAVMTSAGVNRSLSDTDIEDFSHDDKESTAVGNIRFYGGTYRRGDGEEVQVTYNYPSIWDGEWSNIGSYELVIDKPNIKNYTEARDYCANLFARLNSPDQMSATLKLYAYSSEIVVSNKVDLVIDGLTLVDEPVLKVNTSYDVGNDLAIKHIQVGWQHTSIWDKFVNWGKKVWTNVVDLYQVAATETVQHSALLRVDGIIEGENISFDQVTIINQGAGGDIVMTSNDAAAKLDLAAAVLANATLDDAVVSEANVSQHEAALAVPGSLLSDSVPDNRIVSSSVTQHETDITSLGTLTELNSDSVIIGPNADNPFTMTLTEESPGLWFLGLSTNLAASDVWFIMQNLGASGTFNVSIPDRLNVSAGQLFVDSSGVSITTANITTLTFNNQGAGAD
ncbi:hypothetical protein LCGC14_1965690, partial [marine sediment metagenome]